MEIASDVRYAVRALMRSRGFTAVAVVSLALGIGANTAIFSVANALLLHPLPYQDADRLVILWNRSPGLGITEDWFSTAQYFDIRNGHTGFEQVAIAIGANYNLTGSGEPERIGAIRVSSNLLPMLGAKAAVGRLFLPEDDVEGRSGTAVLGYSTWMRRYGGNPAAVGTSVTLNGQPYQIVGVLPQSFSLPREVMPTLGVAENSDILLPLPLGPKAAETRSREDYNVVGKLKRGVTLTRAQAEMDAMTARLRREYPQEYPPNGGLTFGIVPLQEQVVGDVRRPLILLVAAVGFVLLIACANVASLLLSRALVRQREIAVRTALGATGGRIVRQLLTESVILALAGGALALPLSFAAVTGIHLVGARSVPRLDDISVNGEALFFTLMLSAVSGILFGLVPAARAAGVDPQRALQGGGRGATGTGVMWGRRQNVRGLLVALEIALAVVVLISAGLLVRSFSRLQDVPVGFNPRSVLTLELTMTGRKYNDATSVTETYRRLWTRLNDLPGVTASGGVSALPLSQMMAWGPITVEGRTPPAGEQFINADQRIVAGDYFRAMEIPLLKGRVFDDRDGPRNPRVVIVDDNMARQLWPGADPIGKRLRTGIANSTSPWLTVVGVVGRIKQDTVEGDSRIAMYFAHTQSPSRAMNVVVRSMTDPSSITAAVRGAVHGLDPDLPLYNVRTMADRIDASLARRRFAMLLMTLFAGLALGLAALGVYGVIGYLVNQGARDVGIRIALGATPRGIVMLIVRHALAIAVPGILAGVGAAVVLTRFMRSLLFGVEATDPFTFVAIAVTLMIVALVAAGVPARRAARVDPTVTLRSE